MNNIGMIGLGVMSSSLARNMASKGFSVACYDWDEKLYHAPDLAAFISSLSHPWKIMLMIKAGAPVDSVVGPLILLLAKGDVIIAGENTHKNSILHEKRWHVMVKQFQTKWL